MLRLFLLLVILFLLFIFVRELKRYFTRDKKVEELRETLLEGDLVDLDKDIAEEKSRQNGVSSKIEELNSDTKTKNEDNKDD